MDQITDQLIELALQEDIGTGDVTSQYFTKEDTVSTGYIIAKQNGVLAGIEVTIAVFEKLNSDIKTEILLKDGSKLSPGDQVLKIEGSSRDILTAERTALNFLQRLSGVATHTARFVEKVRPHKVKVLDTRKTTPGYRMLQKAAVVAGGGTNHRMGLYDAVMVKDNHLLTEDDISELQKSINQIKKERPEVDIILEADTLDQVKSFLTMEEIDVVLLDNMNNEKLVEAVTLVDDKFELEASGGINLDTIAGVAATGVDRISVGALTHSAISLDLSLDLEEV